MKDQSVDFVVKYKSVDFVVKDQRVNFVVKYQSVNFVVKDQSVNFVVKDQSVKFVAKYQSVNFAVKDQSVDFVVKEQSVDADWWSTVKVCNHCRPDSRFTVVLGLQEMQIMHQHYIGFTVYKVEPPQGQNNSVIDCQISIIKI